MAACRWVQASGAGPCLEPAKACPHACANAPQAGWGLPAEAPWWHCTPVVRQIPENPQEWEASVCLAEEWLFTRQTLRLKDTH